MIIVFPMLVSRAVSENSIPGIAKLLENYIIVNFQDYIINNTDIKKQMSGMFKLSISSNKIMVKESENLLEALPPDAEETNHKKQTNIYQKSKDVESRIKDLEDKKIKERDRLKVNVSDMKSISLEPTYITVEHTDRDGIKTNIFIGIKVVPMRVKSDIKLSHLLLQDSQLNSLMALMLHMGRKLMRSFYSLLDRWTHRVRLGGLTVSGDPRRDIIMGRSGFGKNSDTFIVLSKQEDVDEYFLDNIPRINRLFSLGWGNFIIADDISRTAFFCMRKFKGICNAVPYAMMYQYLGQAKAYESLEDAKKANSSIFKMGKRFSKVLGEWIITNKLNKYSQLNEGNHDE